VSAVLSDPRLTRAAALVIGTYFVAEWLFRPAMTLAVIVSGLAVMTVAVTLAVQRVIAGTPATLVATAGIALALTGVITDYPLHASAFTVFKVLGAIGIILIGTGTALGGSVRFAIGLAGGFALIGYFSLVGGHTGVLDIGVIQRLTIYPVLVSVMILAVVRPGVSASPNADVHDEVAV
jgi:hypothetical membrane protein